MRVVELRKRFGLESLHVATRPDPRPGPGQALLRMHAASLNYRDLMTVRGDYNPRQPLPLIPCSDGAGEVVEVGPEVDRVRIGDRVTPIFAQRWLAGSPTPEELRSTLGGPLDGTLAEFMALDAAGLVHVPDHLSYEQAATLPCAALTAWSALVTHGGLKAGDSVLVQGTGGVSMFALQFARLFGARAIVTSSSDEKLARARELGAVETINYRTTPDWGKRARELAGGTGVDHVVEVGGSGTLTQSLAAVAAGGSISVIGVLSGAEARLSIVPILMKSVRIQGIFVGHREGFTAMNLAIAASRLEPVIDRVFPLDEIRPAFDTMAAGGHFGKICIRVGT